MKKGMIHYIPAHLQYRERNPSFGTVKRKRKKGFPPQFVGKENVKNEKTTGSS
jgi:hypothetical protein